ncbi:PREDICTED: uncharacterized protein LOC109216324 [Nicotiana attenuata]|uniref:uncharacterized protein LOC109216324 n=1 Tax=Nicotiana attenuata TaxID=49451 RepID=UPI00090586C9|nr:PREDICTED: uncharacterized protein LOC109216324 [Nicotiana attenuata]
MARRRKPVTPATEGTTPVNSTMQNFTPLTFGSFLPPKFHQILEEKELSEDEEGNSMQWNSKIAVTAKEAQKSKEQLPTSPKRLQFSEAGSSQPSPDLDLTDKTEMAKELRKQNRNSQMGMKLEYIQPSHRDGKIVIQIEENDVNELQEHWATALIGYVLGDTPYEKSMESYIESVWDFVTKPQILYHQDGYYVFRFTTMENWERDFHFDPKCITTIPLWIHLPSLSAGYWTADALSKVASAVGLPLYTDKFTAELNKISYARKFDITKPLVEKIEIVTPTETRQQEIVYEWRPKFCNDCLHFGHDSFECWNSTKQKEDAEFKVPKRRNRGRGRKVIQEWKPKPQQGQEEGQGEENKTYPPATKDR